MDSGSLAITVALLAATIAVASLLFGPKYDPKEPPVIHPKIPFIGHLVGLLRYGLRYFEILSTKYPIPIFTLQILGRRIYVVNSPDLISAVQKDAKNLSFGPFVSWMSPRIFDVGDEAMAAINENTDGTKGLYGLLPEISRGMHTALAPSDSLDWMTKTMLTKLGEFVDPLGANPDGTEIDLFKWVRTAFTVASTEATYGPKNPFNHKPNLENDFWDFESDITMILLGVLPSVTARKGYQARQRFTEALTEYFNDNGPETGSDLIRARWAGEVKYNVAQYAGKFEIGDLIGVLINATPSFFWMLLHIFSRPALLAALRAELAAIVEKETTTTTTKTLPLSKLKSHCPLLLATYKETLRLQTHNTNTRWVKTSTSLADRYVLKQDGIIQMPGYPVHTLPEIWGEDARDFNPNRFIKTEQQKKKKKEREKYPSSSFRSFGGGATLCPGRHFATAEICAAAAMVVMRFDIVPVDHAGGDGGTGKWKIPTWKHGRIASSVPPPAKDVRVKVTTRKGEEGWEWRWGFEGSVDKFEVVW